MSDTLLYIVSSKCDARAVRIKEFCSKRRIRSTILSLDSDNDISIFSDSIRINNNEIPENSIFFNIGLKPDYLALPEFSESGPDSFNIGHVSSEQKLSHLLSLLFMADNLDKYHVINPPFKLFDYISTGYFTGQMKQEGFPVYQSVYTNSLEYFEKTDIYGNNEYFIWSYPVNDAPEQLISKKNIDKLFRSGHTMPFYISEFIPGIDYSVWFYRGTAIFGTGLTPPERNQEITLEKFEYIPPNIAMNNLGELTYRLNNIDFYQIKGVINKDGNLIFRKLIPLPDITDLGKMGKDYLLNVLMKKIFAMADIKLRISKKFPVNESRTNVFLTRMLDPLFEAINPQKEYE